MGGERGDGGGRGGEGGESEPEGSRGRERGTGPWHRGLSPWTVQGHGPPIALPALIQTELVPISCRRSCTFEHRASAFA